MPKMKHFQIFIFFPISNTKLRLLSQDGTVSITASHGRLTALLTVLVDARGSDPSLPKHCPWFLFVPVQPSSLFSSPAHRSSIDLLGQHAALALPVTPQSPVLKMVLQICLFLSAAARGRCINKAEEAGAFPLLEEE